MMDFMTNLTFLVVLLNCYKKWSSAYRQLKEINAEYSNLYKARIKLSRKEYGVDAAIKKVPEYLINDEGLTYERVKWRRHAKLSSSLDLLSNYLDKNEKFLEGFINRQNEKINDKLDLFE